MVPLLASSMSKALQELQYSIRTMKIHYNLLYLQELVAYKSDTSIF